jgi:MFS transporter, ACS family, tartrate transporter
VVVGASSDRTGERHRHLAVPALIGVAGLVMSAATTNPLLALLTLSIAAAGIWGGLGPFWALPTTYLSGTAAAGGIALINSIGNLGGFLGPALVGRIVATTGSYSIALVTISASLVATFVIALVLRELSVNDSPKRAA